ncbi:MAG TPA: Crp/Fnr family transcriptional regulator [Stellaceae bacterium]|nr:Crp/Fnr family transcriptional regulator [Stellaceae bacterium]
MKGEVGQQVIVDQAERRRPVSPRDFWAARIVSALGLSECRVLELSPGNATVQIDHPVAENQAVTLIMERLGELSGVVAWQREGCIGIHIIEHRPFGDSHRTTSGGWTAGRAEPVSSRQAPVPAEMRERPDGATPAPEGIAVERWGGDPDLLEVFHEEPRIVALQPGEILFKEGDPGTSMFVVRDGVLRIRSGSVVYEDVVRGGVVGEMGLVEKLMPRSATVYALTASELVEIDEERFFLLVERQPQIAITVMRVLSRRLRHMDGRYRVARWTDPHR